MATAPHAIVIGASAGGVGALLELLKALPGPLAAVTGVVLHVGARHSVLPELLQARGANASHAREGDLLEAGRILVAPPDHHLLFTAERARLSRGARENHARPAIDPLFRSTAIAWGERAIGVVLTGDLDDGTAGLAAIKRCGGIAIVQDPHTAVEPSMPHSALAHVLQRATGMPVMQVRKRERLKPNHVYVIPPGHAIRALANVEVDHCLDIPGIARLLHSLAQRPAATADGREPPQALVRENAMTQEHADVDETLKDLSQLATPSGLTCPECGGGLWEMKGDKPLRYRCHTGHAYTSGTLGSSQEDRAEQALWASVRALREREMLLRRVAVVSEATGDSVQAQAGRREADRVREESQRLVELIETSRPRA